MTQEQTERLMEIESRIEWMNENLEGCDWCCGGGDIEMKMLEREKSDILKVDNPASAG